jgi:7-dehydrocholesterol reductase
MIVLPGKKCKGEPTPTGNRLDYKCNAATCFFVTVALYFVFGHGLHWFPPGFAFYYFGAIVKVTTIVGLSLSLAAYIKGLLWPTNADCTIRGPSYFFYDFCLGTELNPRIFGFDIKLFFIGRVGMIGWGIMILSYATAQYELYGYISNSMVLLVVLQMVYVIDWAWKESWYLATLDIMHDHFGFFLGYGAACWIKTAYTAQAWYLVHYPVHLSLPSMLLIIAINASGYFIFRASNNQKLSFRASQGKCTIWGKPAVFVEASYRTSDGKQAKNLLLASGFWGLSRHFNYFGDLLITASFCMCCGFTHIVPWTYMFFMAWLLVYRAHRDDLRCRTKYGADWN